METKKIKIYTDKKYLTQENYEPILFPFWGLSPTEKESPFGGQFDEYIKNGKNYFEMTTVENCDYVVLPEKYNKSKIDRFKPLLNLADIHDKPILIFFLDDSAEKINIKNSYIFRTSLYKKNKSNNEFSMPSWVEDFTSKYFNGNLPAINKQSKISVSYCGYTKNWKDWIKQLIGKDYGIWRSLRYRCVNILKKDKRIITKFIIRNDFWGGAYYKKNKFSQKQLLELQMRVRLEYINNLLEGAYALATRGNGNFSMRFYEILGMGRIPLFINTDCVLPFEDFIDWKKLCVWVEDHELDTIVDKLINFDNNTTSENIKKLQEEIYNTYTQWLSPDGFYKNIHLYLSR
jgi:hypothetical protein